jgi:hypothetical protein
MAQGSKPDEKVLFEHAMVMVIRKVINIQAFLPGRNGRVSVPGAACGR